MKRVFLILLAIAVFICVPINSCAAEVLIYGNAVNAKPNSIFFVPVNIKNNPGIMGFKITVKYDPEILTYPVVTRGSVTESGTINDSIGVSEAGTFDVVWSNDSQVVGDGTVIVLSFNVDNVSVENTKVSFQFSQDDTFNEQYEDVSLTFRDIVVSFNESDVSNTYLGEVKEPDYKDVIVAVEAELREKGIESVEALDPDFNTEFVSKVNETITVMTGTQNYFGSVDEISSAYKAATVCSFVSATVDSVDPNEIDEIISSALKAVGADSVDTIADEKKGAFIAAVESGIAEHTDDNENISGVLSEDEAIEAIKELQSANNQTKNGGKKVAKLVNNAKYAAIITSSVAAAGIIAVVIVLINKKRKSEAKIDKGVINDEENG